MRFLSELAQARALKSVIDRRYPFGQIVEAHRHIEQGTREETSS
jgi:NADPH:quinone reductase-like Zn-dependent oxidoreductase